MLDAGYIIVLANNTYNGFHKISFSRKIEANYILKNNNEENKKLKIIYYKKSKYAKTLATKIIKNISENNHMVLKDDKDWYFISSHKIVGIIRSLTELLDDESYDSKHIADPINKLEVTRAELGQINKWEKIDRVDKWKIFIPQLKINHGYCGKEESVWLMLGLSHFALNDLNAYRYYNDLINPKSEIYKVHFYHNEKKFSVHYYSAYSHTMGTGKILLDDIINEPPIRDINEPNAEPFKYVYEFVNSLQQS